MTASRAGFNTGLRYGGEELLFGLCFGLCAMRIGMGLAPAVVMSIAAGGHLIELGFVHALSFGLSPYTPILSTILLVLPNLPISRAIMRRVQKAPDTTKLLLAFRLDELSGGLLLRNKKQAGDPAFLAGCQAALFLAQLLGTLIGCLIYRLLPPSLMRATGFAFFCFFAQETARKIAGSKAKSEKERYAPLLVLALSLLLTLLLSRWIPQGYSALPAMLIAAFAVG